MSARSTPHRLRRYVSRALSGPGLHVWVPAGDAALSCLVRVARYPDRLDTRSAEKPLRMTAVRGEEVRCQVAVLHTEGLTDLTASVRPPRGPGDPLPTRLNWVGYHPVIRDPVERPRWARYASTHAPHEVSGDGAPDVIADALLPVAEPVQVPACAAQPLWITVAVPPDAEAGSYEGQVVLAASGGVEVRLTLRIDVLPVDLPAVPDRGFSVDIWFSPDAVAAAHGVPLWSPQHWELIDRYLSAQARLGQRGIAVAVVDNPWVAAEMVDTPWLAPVPGQVSQTTTGRTSTVAWAWDGTAWSFDFHLLDQLVHAADRAGVGPVITAYSLLAFSGAQRLTYRDTRTGDTVVEEVALGDDRWRGGWTAFLRAFEAHVRDRGWLDRVRLGFDEQPPEQLRIACDLVAAAAPTFRSRIAIAGTDRVLPFADDACVAWEDLHRVPAEVIAERRAQGKVTTFYTCCVGDHPNCLAWSPAVESRMIPWLAASRDLDGYLRWALNEWPADVWNDPAFRFPQGDEYLVYPGTDGPWSSIRWELLHQGVQDVGLLTLARASAGRDHPLLRAAEALATSHPDARTKDLADLAHARRLVEAVLREAHAQTSSGVATGHRQEGKHV